MISLPLSRTLSRGALPFLGFMTAIASSLLVGSAPVWAQYNEVRLASRLSNGASTSGTSETPALNALDGRYLVFATSAALATDDTNDVSDIYLFDRADSSVTRLSLTSANGQVLEPSTEPTISSDGRYVGFVSEAQLVTSDTNSNLDVYVYDRTGATLTRASVKSDGSQLVGTYTVSEPTLSADGAVVAFITDGKFVTTDTNSNSDVYVHVQSNGAVTRASLRTGGLQLSGTYVTAQPSLSSDGQYVAFTTDGAFITNDTNTLSDIYRYDRTGEIVLRVSERNSTTPADGDSTHATISSSGDIVAFSSEATNLVSKTDDNDGADIFVRAITAATNTVLSLNVNGTLGNGASTTPAISADGRYIAFRSAATNLVPGDSNSAQDIFVFDRTADKIFRVSVGTTGSDTDGDSGEPAITNNAQWIAYSSTAQNLVTGDINNLKDVFLANSECVIDDLVVTTAADFDSDATTNCNDGCGADATKTSAGTCGCGIADTDTDGDATADCLDGCPSSAQKTAVGSCGCGIADIDADANGVADCLDPTTLDVPKAAYLSLGRRIRGSQKLTVQIPNGYSGVRYKVSITGAEKQTKTTKVSSRTATFLLKKRGTYVVRYRVVNGSVQTRFSERASIRVR